MWNLQGKTILVTGATGTIGQAIASRLDQAGAQVVLQYRDQEELAKHVLSKLQHQPIAIQGNLSSEAGVSSFLHSVGKHNLKFHGLVNNAADQSIGPLLELDYEQWHSMLQTNLTAVFTLSQWFVRAVEQDSGGAIVNISSIEGSDPAFGHGHYATSKAGLNMFTRSLALEAGEKNIRVNSIAPGLIRRDGIEEQWPEGVSSWQSKAPLKRLGEADDVANATLFLLSQGASWISGAHLVVDGGMSTHPRW